MSGGGAREEVPVELVASAPRVVEPTAPRPGRALASRDVAVAATGAVAALTLTAALRSVLPRRRRRRRRRGLDVIGTRSFLIDVHVLRS